MNSIQKEMNNVTQTATEFFTAAKKTPLNIIDRPLNKPKKDVPSHEFTSITFTLVHLAMLLCRVWGCR
jgi:hypothetical protein